jgi:hypothetical protein
MPFKIEPAMLKAGGILRAMDNWEKGERNRREIKSRTGSKSRKKAKGNLIF